MQTAAIRSAGELELPDPELATEIFEALTEQRAREFAAELVRALWEAKRRNNLRPVQEAVEAWYRTMQFVRRGEAFSDESILEEEPMTVEEVKAYMEV